MPTATSSTSGTGTTSVSTTVTTTETTTTRDISSTTTTAVADKCTPNVGPPEVCSDGAYYSVTYTDGSGVSRTAYVQEVCNAGGWYALGSTPTASSLEECASLATKNGVRTFLYRPDVNRCNLYGFNRDFVSGTHRGGVTLGSSNPCSVVPSTSSTTTVTDGTSTITSSSTASMTSTQTTTTTTSAASTTTPAAASACKNAAGNFQLLDSEGRYFFVSQTYLDGSTDESTAASWFTEYGNLNVADDSGSAGFNGDGSSQPARWIVNNYKDYGTWSFTIDPSTCQATFTAGINAAAKYWLTDGSGNYWAYNQPSGTASDSTQLYSVDVYARPAPMISTTSSTTTDSTTSTTNSAATVTTSTTTTGDLATTTSSITTITVSMTTSGTSTTTLTADAASPTSGQPFSIQVRTGGSKHKRDIMVVGFVNGQLVLVSSTANAVAFVLTDEGVLMIFGTGLVVGFGGGSGTSALMIYSSLSAMPTTLVWSVSGGALVLPGAGFCVAANNVMSVNVGTATDSSCSPVTPVPDTDADSYNTAAASTISASPQTTPSSSTTTTDGSTTLSTAPSTTATSSTSDITTTTVVISTSTSDISSSDSTTTTDTTIGTTTTSTFPSLTEETNGPNCSIMPLQDQTAPNGAEYTQFFYSCHAAIPVTFGSYSSAISGQGSYSRDPTAFLNQCVANAETTGATVWTYYQSSPDFNWHCGFWTGLQASDDLFVEDSTVFTMNAMKPIGGGSSTTTTIDATTTTTISQSVASSSTTESTTEASTTTASPAIPTICNPDPASGYEGCTSACSNCIVPVGASVADAYCVGVSQCTACNSDADCSDGRVCASLQTCVDQPGYLGNSCSEPGSSICPNTPSLVTTTTIASTTTSASDYITSTTTALSPTADTTSSDYETTTGASSTTTDDVTPTSTLLSVSYTPSCTVPMTYCISMIAEIIVDHGTCPDGGCDAIAYDKTQTDGAMSWLISNEEWYTLSEPASVLTSYQYQHTCGEYDLTYTGYVSDAGCGTNTPSSGEDTTTTIDESLTTTISGYITSTTSDSSTTDLSTAVTSDSASAISSTTTDGATTTTTTTTSSSPIETEYVIQVSTTPNGRKTKRDFEYLAFNSQTGLSSLVDSASEASTFSSEDDGQLIVLFGTSTIWVGVSETSPQQLVLETTKPEPPVTATIASDGTISISGLNVECVLDGKLVVSDTGYAPAGCVLVTLSSVAANVAVDSGTTTTIDARTTTTSDDLASTTTTSDYAATTISSDDSTMTTFASTISTESPSSTTTSDLPATTTPVCSAPAPWGDISPVYNSSITFSNFYTGCGESLQGNVALGQFNNKLAVKWDAPNYEGYEFGNAMSHCAQYAYQEDVTIVEFYVGVDQNWYCIAIANAEPSDDLFSADPNVAEVYGFAWQNQCGIQSYGDFESSNTVFSEFYTGCSTSLEGNTQGGLVNLNRVVSNSFLPENDHYGWTFDAAMKQCGDDTVSAGGTMFEFYTTSDDTWYCIAVNDLPADSSSFYYDASVVQIWGFAVAGSVADTDTCEPSVLMGDVTLDDGSTYIEYYDGCHQSLEGNLSGGFQGLNAVWTYTYPYVDFDVSTAVQECINSAYNNAVANVEFYEKPSEQAWYCIAVNDIPAEADSFYGDATVGQLWAFVLDADEFTER